MNITPAAMSVEDAAKYIGIGHAMMWEIVAADLVEVRKFGRRTVILRESLDELLARGDLPARKKLAAMKKLPSLPEQPRA